jgi:dethiobiotin synthetase
VLVTGTGTAVGKTFVTRGIAAALRSGGRSVVALKPIETGVSVPGMPTPGMLAPAALTDADALARACGRPELAHAPDLYRAALPLSPYAASLATTDPPPSLPALCATIAALAQGADALLVEGAGGLLVPIDRELSFADLAIALGLPLVMVASDALGVLSHVLTAAESAQRRGLSLAAVVLTQHAHAPDGSHVHNRVILQERLACPVLAFARCEDDDLALAAAARSSGLLAHLDALLTR